MPRKLRLEYPGAIYHVMNRGDRRDDIVWDEADRRRFAEALGEACGKTGWQVHAWCLMRNHFHLVVETPQPNLVAGMQWLLGTYTARFNRRHKVFGHLFSGRYKSLIVDGAGGGYLKTVCDYVHLNPARARLLKPEEPLSAFAWSSYPLYLSPPSRRPPWLRVGRLLGEEVGEHHYGKEIRESVEARAERLVAEGLSQAGWQESDLELRPKGDGVKVGLARRLRQETTLGWRWIATRLRMGHWRSAANAVRLQQ